MKTTRIQKLLSLILCLALIAAVALTTVGCNGSTTQAPETSADTTAATAADTTPEEETDAVTVKGEGATVFYFNVVDGDGKTTRFEIHTDKTVVGDALSELGLIVGEKSSYGLYVKMVNGIMADYNTTGTWWEFFVGEQSSMTGVDRTKIEAGATYAFKISK